MKVQEFPGCGPQLLEQADIAFQGSGLRVSDLALRA